MPASIVPFPRSLDSRLILGRPPIWLRDAPMHEGLRNKGRNEMSAWIADRLPIEILQDQDGHGAPKIRRDFQKAPWATCLRHRLLLDRDLRRVLGLLSEELVSSEALGWIPGCRAAAEAFPATSSARRRVSSSAIRRALV